CILILGKFTKNNRLLISFFPICLFQFFIATLLGNCIQTYICFFFFLLF
ncbi:hypothetical protein, partial [Plasmodium yoelii yoelii]